MKSVLVVDPAAAWYEEQLRPRFPDATIRGTRSFEEAAAHLAEAEVLVTMGVPGAGVHFTRDVAAKMQRLEWIQCLVSGYEHISRALDGREEVLVTTVRGIHGPQMSEMAVMLMLMLGRAAPRMMRNQAALVWEPMEQRGLAEKAVGIVGMGAIGTHLARTCKALGMTVYGVSRTDRPVEGVDRLYDRSGLLDVAAEVDYLVLVLPATPETDKMVNARVLAAMKPTAHLINLARGSVVDEGSLIDALRAGQIAGAALDAFATEPLPPTSQFWEMENVIVTPHVGGRSDNYALQTLTVVEPNLRRYLDGNRAELVNLVRGA